MLKGEKGRKGRYKSSRRAGNCVAGVTWLGS